MPFELQLFTVQVRLDMAKEIFVGPDRATRRPRHPFNLECPFRFHAREFLDGPILGNNVPVTPDAGEMATAEGQGREGQKFRRQKRPDRDRAHTNCLFGSEMRLRGNLDSEIYGIDTGDSDGSDGAAPCPDTAARRRYLHPDWMAGDVAARVATVIVPARTNIAAVAEIRRIES